jgi:ABC-type molybdate transport system substrate-binding protein
VVVVSVLTFIIGFICGHYFTQRQRKLTQQEQTMSTSTAAAANEPVEELELRDNVAYVTLRPK